MTVGGKYAISMLYAELDVLAEGKQLIFMYLSILGFLQ